ncbi:hypothetical protein [Vibrio genomosp. F10]|uniref:Uncharacterized protein n=1 Tax=Vibrio genomosp. F10 TaxID=723171 RepID=A0A1B9QUX9_9VIBR|nr:hypothetical protein [Vibrio genomosp. F10]OCH72286.1 hypothetical protein A6E14_15760 [Vibrio genomosp. F10]
MNKHLIPLLVTASFFSTHTLAEEEYSYIATPVATQLDDLLDDDRERLIVIAACHSQYMGGKYITQELIFGAFMTIEINLSLKIIRVA